MIDLTTDENIKKMLKSAFKPSALSPEYREQLLKDLIVVGDSAVLRLTRPLWKKPDLWAAIAAVIILAIISYGVWLPHTVVTNLFP